MQARTTQKQTFKVGDKAVYPAQGVAEVTSIEEKDIAGNRLKFYVLRILDTNRRIMVPINNAKSVGLEARELCRDVDAVELAGSTTDRIWILATFCIGSRLGRGASARGPAPAAMSPEFRNLLDNMLLNLFRIKTSRPKVG